MPNYYYYQIVGGEEDWQCVSTEMRANVEQQENPAFFTVLALNVIADKENNDKSKLKYSGPFYLDWDSQDIEFVIEQTTKCLLHLEEYGVNLNAVNLYATGGKGFHCEVPMKMFMQKVPRDGILYLPAVYKEMAYELAVDTLDLRIYSGGRGRMWRSPNVRRQNGRYKVPISWEEMQRMTPAFYQELTSAPRIGVINHDTPTQAVKFSILFDKATQKVKDRVGKRKKKTVDFDYLKTAALPSLEALLEGKGIKVDIGFHQIALQLAIISDTLGWSEDDLVSKASGLIETHSSDGTRYNTAAKRRAELVRMHRYCADNPCYEFSVGAVKSLLNHSAPDLDGVPVERADIDEDIKNAESTPRVEQANGHAVLDEFDAARGIDMTRYGIFADRGDGFKQRICAVAFDNVHILRSPVTGQVSSYEADVLINGKVDSRQMLDLEVFHGVASLNRFTSRMSHAFQGNDIQARSVMMRLAEKGRKEGKTFYMLSREGLDILSIPNHDDESLRIPFKVWADKTGVHVEPRVKDKALEFVFKGYPDPRGYFGTDLSDAPKLAEWVADPDKKQRLLKTIKNLIRCQRPEVMSKLLGWYMAAFYRMMFHKHYKQFPLLHVNGSAGAGKTQLNLLLGSFFFYNQEVKSITPESSPFAIQATAAGSASIPLIIDEYKPHEMSVELHNKLKLMFRDAYNCREVSRGGGTRDNEDYRVLYSTQLAAPICFISEAAEDEAAVMERVVLVTVVRPPVALQQKWSEAFYDVGRNRQQLAMIGKYIAADTVTNYTIENLMQEFDPIYDAAQSQYMLKAEDFSAGLSDEEFRQKSGAKLRTVFNFSVAKFGLIKFQQLVETIFGEKEFAVEFAELHEQVYARMADLLPSTQPEWVKVLNTMATMTTSVDANSPTALRKGVDYAHIEYGGKDALEIAARGCYHKYRSYARASGYKPLFPGDHAFLHALKDTPALIASGQGVKLAIPGGTYVFDLAELRKLGVEEFA